MAQSFSIQGNEIEYMEKAEEMIHLFFPAAAIVSQGKGDYHLEFHFFSVNAGKVIVKLEEQNTAKKWEHYEQKNGRTKLGMKDENERMVKLAVFYVLQRAFPHLASSWGILRGIRPTKLAHYFWDEGFEMREIGKLLESGYGLREDKARLICDIARLERQYLLSHEEMLKKISIYIGIPFCPTRCIYCSFVSCTMKQGEKWLIPYMHALEQEIKAIGQWMNEKGIIADNIYIGGGTPTVLPLERLQTLLNTIATALPQVDDVEYTMEAGRPDSMTTEKLHLLREKGINRLCINPQTLNDKTLKVIGREHSVADFIEVFKWAREIGFPTINSDIIIGLPGEQTADVHRTLEILLSMQPENITVHTMAVKRGSRLIERLEDTPLPETKQVEEMLSISQETLTNAGYIPYYLYRQKRILAHLENVGYTLSGHVCRYNIQMIEERQNILGLGAGASSKFVTPDQRIIEAAHNPKDPNTYIGKLGQVIREKIMKMEAVLTRE